MIKKNIVIVAIVILFFVAFLAYDSGNADKRSGIYTQALSILDAIRSEEKLIERISRILVRLDLLITKLTSSKDTNEKQQQTYNMAIRDRNELSAKLVEFRSKGKRLIDKFNNLAGEYNRTTRPILFGEKELPSKMVKYEKPNLPNSSDTD